MTATVPTHLIDDRAALRNALRLAFAVALAGANATVIFATGAIVGSMIVAFSELALTFAWKKALTYLVPAGLAPEGMVQLLSTEYKFAVSFLILVIVLLVRPAGLYGKAAK